jgi:trimeric autotransporter adhesin
MQKLFPVVLLACSFHGVVLAQTVAFSVGAASAAPGASTPLNFSMTASGGAQAESLEWSLSYSPADVSSIAVSAGPAATSAGKTVACSTGNGTVMCLLYGIDSTVISSGVVAQVAVNLSPTTHSTSTAIQVSGPMAASAAGESIPATGSGGTVTILQPSTGLTGLTCSPATFSAAGSASCTVTLSVAPTASLAVSLSSSTTSVSVPTSVTVPTGSTTATFSATIAAVTANLTAVITGAVNSTQKTASIALSAPPQVSALTCNPASMTGAGSISCTVTLTVAPAAPLTVGLSSSSTSVSVPASVTVPAGSTTGTFTAPVTAVTANLTAVITAIANSTQKTASIALSAPPQVSALTCNPASMIGAGSISCTITLSVAPATSLAVNLSSSTTSVSVPTTVTVPTGSTTATFSATITAVTANLTAVITATANSTQKTASIALSAPPHVSALTCNPASVIGSGNVSCTITMNVAPAAALFVFLTSSSTSLSVPNSATVTAGSTTATFTAQVAALTANLTATITAAVNGIPQTASIALFPIPNLSALSCTPTTVGGPASLACSIALTGAAPAGGLSAALSSSNSEVVVPASVSVPAGSTTVNFTGTVSSLTTSGVAVIKASAGSVSESESITLSPEHVSLLTCSPASVPSGSSTTCTVTLVNAAMTAGVTVSLSSANAAVSVPSSVTVASGATTATFTATAGGSVNEPILVTASLNGTSAEATITVSALQIEGIPTEISGPSNGSSVNPTIAPAGFTGQLVVTGNGAANFAAVGSGEGVDFLNCCSNTNTAHYKFTGTELGNLFNLNQGQISFTLKSSYSFAQRQTIATAPRYVFDVQDNVAAMHHLFYFFTEYTTVYALQNYLVFSYMLAGANHFYFVPVGTESALFGSGVNLQVTLSWKNGVADLYLNGALVQSSSYTPSTAAWTASSIFDLGAYEYLTFGGYNSCDDHISGFTVGAPVSQ